MDKKKKPIKFKVVKPKPKPTPQMEEKKKKIKFKVVKIADRKLDELKKKAEEQTKKDGIKRRVLPTGEVQKKKTKPKPSELQRVAGVSKEQANKMDTAELFGKLPVELRKMVLDPKTTGVQVGKDELQLAIFDGESYKEYIDDINDRDIHYSNIFYNIFAPTFKKPNDLLPSFNQNYTDNSITGDYDFHKDDYIEDNLMDIAHAMKFDGMSYQRFLGYLKKRQPKYFSYFIQYYSYEASEDIITAKYINKLIKITGSKKDINEDFRDNKLEIKSVLAGDTGNMLIGKKPNLVGVVILKLPDVNSGSLGVVDIKKITEDKDGNFSVNINNVIERENRYYGYWNELLAPSERSAMG
jgi:hypothetical protein